MSYLGTFTNFYPVIKKHVKLMMGKNAIDNKINKNIIPYWTKVDYIYIYQGIKIFKKFRQKHPDEIFEIRLEDCDFQKINKLKYEGLIIETKKAHIKYGSEGPVSVFFKEGLTTIGERAFYWCTSLTSVTFPEGLTTIGKNAFKNCISLTSVTFSRRVDDHWRGCIQKLHRPHICDLSRRVDDHWKGCILRVHRDHHSNFSKRVGDHQMVGILSVH